MDLRQLQYFLAAVDNGGFTRGAEALDVAQPSMSLAIGALERELHVDLFVRTGRSVRLTAAGETLAEHARRVVREASDLSAVAASIAGVVAGRLAVVALSTLAVDPLTACIGAMRERHPGVTITVHEPDDAADIERWLSSGRADLALTDVTTGGHGLARVELYRQEIVAVCPAHLVHGSEALTARELAAMPLIAAPRGTSTRRLLDQVLTRAGGEPNIVVETDHREAIVPLVAAGAGAALVPTALARDAERHGAVVRPLRPPVSRRVGLLHRRGPLAPAARTMIDVTRAVTATPAVGSRRAARGTSPAVTHTRR